MNSPGAFLAEASKVTFWSCLGEGVALIATYSLGEFDWEGEGAFELVGGGDLGFQGAPAILYALIQKLVTKVEFNLVFSFSL